MVEQKKTVTLPPNQKSMSAGQTLWSKACLPAEFVDKFGYWIGNKNFVYYYEML